jgi:hypothetical protein
MVHPTTVTLAGVDAELAGRVVTVLGEVRERIGDIPGDRPDLRRDTA